ncbi:MAG TPA: glutaredoxin family protein, partial [Bacilli bacterium]|nr:glutaredoxin family protein [Bacilli bacterium]
KGQAILEEIQQEVSYNLEVIDIYKDDELLEKYQLMIPVVCIGDEEIDFGQLSKKKIQVAIENKLA